MNKTMVLKAIPPMLLVLLVMAAVTANASSSASAINKAFGTSPAQALNVTCNWESLPAASNVWYRLPRRDDRPIQVRLVSHPETLEGMEFQVYGADLVDDGVEPVLSSPVGTSHFGDAKIVKEWEGAAVDQTVYYVNLTNSNSMRAYYGFCD